MGSETPASFHQRGGQFLQMQPWGCAHGSSGAALGPLLPPNSPNLYPHFDAIYLYGLHLKVDTWGKEASEEVSKGTC